jgi:hypothetical protein
MSLEHDLVAAGPAPPQDQFEVARDVRTILRMLRPHKVNGFSKVRVGSRNDGGYICIEDFQGLDTAFSFGIEQNPSWDMDVADRGLTVHQFDHTVEAPCPDDSRMIFNKKMISDVSNDESESLDALIRRYDRGRERPNIILKLDIENYEWMVFDAIDPELLARVAQITGEFHAFEWMSYPVWRRRTQRALKNITDKFALVHVHGNNHAAINKIANITLPNVMEFTFVNRQLYDLDYSDEVFPTPVDAPCNPLVPDIFLGCFRF